MPQGGGPSRVVRGELPPAQAFPAVPLPAGARSPECPSGVPRPLRPYPAWPEATGPLYRPYVVAGQPTLRRVPPPVCREHGTVHSPLPAAVRSE
jgi:hypothetical protein